MLAFTLNFSHIRSSSSTKFIGHRCFVNDFLAVQKCKLMNHYFDVFGGRVFNGLFLTVMGFECFLWCEAHLNFILLLLIGLYVGCFRDGAGCVVGVAVFLFFLVSVCTCVGIEVLSEWLMVRCGICGDRNLMNEMVAVLVVHIGCCSIMLLCRQ